MSHGGHGNEDMSSIKTLCFWLLVVHAYNANTPETEEEEAQAGSCGAGEQSTMLGHVIVSICYWTLKKRSYVA